MIQSINQSTIISIMPLNIHKNITHLKSTTISVPLTPTNMPSGTTGVDGINGKEVKHYRGKIFQGKIKTFAFSYHFEL